MGHYPTDIGQKHLFLRMANINLSIIARSITDNSDEMLFMDNLDGSSKIEIISDETDIVLLRAHLVIICVCGEYSFKNSSGIHFCGKDSICLLVKDSFCNFLSASDDCRLAIYTTKTNALHLASSSITNLMVFYRHFRDVPSFEMTEYERMDVISLYKNMATVSGREYVFRNEISQAFDIAMFFILLAHVRIQGNDRKSVSTRQNQIFMNFLSHVSEHFREYRKLDYYANLQCVSVKHLSLAVKNESGYTAHQWISDFVMIEARELLSRRDYSVQEVSDMLHFANQGFFGKFFKTHEGLSPLQYQKNALADDKFNFSSLTVGKSPFTLF